MKILLDTHVFLWYVIGDGRIPAEMLKSLRDPDNAIYLSVVSFWEIILKYQLGKLPLSNSPEVYLPAQRQRHMISNLDLDEASVKQLGKLPSIHRDPFDRMLVCQAIEHKMVLAAIDRKVKEYPVITI